MISKLISKLHMSFIFVKFAYAKFHKNKTPLKISKYTIIFQIKWLKVGEFSGDSKDLFNGFAYQSDHKGIKLSLLAMDPESGVTKVTVKIGSNPGMKSSMCHL